MTHVEVITSLVKAYFSSSKLSETFGISIPNKKKSKFGTITSKVLIGICLALCFGSMAVMLGFNFYSYQAMGQNLLGTDSLGIFMAVTIDFVMLLVFSLFSSSGILYRTKENQLLMTLPIAKQDLLISRIVISYCSLFIMHLFIAIPAIAVLFLKGFNLSALVGAIVFLFISPVIPEALSAFFITLSIRTGRKKTNRSGSELAIYVVLICLVIFIYGLSVRMMNASFNSDMDGLAPFIGFASDAMKYLLPITFIAKASVNEGALGFAWYLLIATGLCFVLFLYIKNNFFYCVSVVQNSSVSKKDKHGVVYKAQKPLVSLYQREWTNLFSNSGFSFELLGEVLIPIILIIIYSAMGIIGEMSEEIGLIMANPYFPAIMTAALSLMGIMNMCSSTSISRQGKDFYKDRNLPCDSSVFVKAKILFHLVLGFIPGSVYFIVCVLFFHVNPLWLLWMLPMCFFNYLFSATVGLCFDYKHPILEWKTAQQAVKQNKNGLFGMAAGLAYILVQGVVYYFLSTILAPAFPIIATLVIGLCSTMLFLGQAYKAASKAYRAS